MSDKKIVNIFGCAVQMTDQEFVDHKWSIDELNPVNLITDEKEEKRQKWLDKKIRPKRNLKLKDADTYKHPDHPKHVEKGETAVLNYVQSLRDMTDQFETIPTDDDKSVVWPEL